MGWTPARRTLANMPSYMGFALPPLTLMPCGILYMELDEQELDGWPAPDDALQAFQHPRAVVLRWEVPVGAKAVRADLYLVQKVGRLSRTRAQRIISRGDFRKSDGPLKPSSPLSARDKVELWRIPPDDDLPEGPPPTVLYDEHGLLVLDKPGDLAIHPSARYMNRTVTAWLKKRGQHEALAHPCHRLDRETSGVLLCASDKGVERELKSAFATNAVQKSYLAVVRGHLVHPQVATFPLGLQGERGLVRIRMIHDPDGLPSETRVAPLAFDAEANRTLVLASPKTGRQHQIRAHLALIGYPIVGDKLYAMGDPFFDAFTREGLPVEGAPLEHPRHALHAYEASFVLQGAPRVFRAPWPEELCALVPALRHAPVLIAARAGQPLPRGMPQRSDVQDA